MEYFYPEPRLVGLVYGGDFTDGITAGGYAGGLDIPILLTSSDKLQTAPKTYLANHADTLISGRVFGGLSVMPPAVAITFDSLLPSSY